MPHSVVFDISFLLPRYLCMENVSSIVDTTIKHKISFGLKKLDPFKDATFVETTWHSEDTSFPFDPNSPNSAAICHVKTMLKQLDFSISSESNHGWQDYPRFSFVIENVSALTFLEVLKKRMSKEDIVALQKAQHAEELRLNANAALVKYKTTSYGTKSDTESADYQRFEDESESAKSKCSIQ